MTMREMIKAQFKFTAKNLRPTAEVYEGYKAMYVLMKLMFTYFERVEKQMDKQIRKIEKENKQEGKALKALEKADKKRDKVCDYGEKMMKKKKQKRK